MELDYLHEFVTLAQICNFQKAANMLYISQSSLSKHIMSLEEELGNSLFIRTTRKVELSGFGSAFLPYAVQIDRIRQEYTAATATSPLPESKKLVIGMLPFSVIYDLTDLIPWFKNEYPSYQLEIVSGETEELRELLRRRQCDAVIVRELPGKEEEFCRLIYTTDPMTAILPAVHPLAREKRISLSQPGGRKPFAASPRHPDLSGCGQLASPGRNQPKNILYLQLLRHARRPCRQGDGRFDADKARRAASGDRNRIRG